MKGNPLTEKAASPGLFRPWGYRICNSKSNLLRPKGGDGHSGGVLLCPLFAGAHTHAHHGSVEGNLHLELLVMVGAGFAGEGVGNGLVLLLLGQLLQGGSLELWD